MRVLVTGGAGRLGIIVCQAFLRSGFQVRVFDLENSATRKNIQRLGGKAEVVWDDITNPDAVRRAVQDAEAVVHMAALLPAAPASNSELTTRVNVGGTQTVIDAIMGEKRRVPLVYTCSVSVFGPTPEATSPLNPDKDGPRPRGIYAETKLQAENVIKASGIDYVILRLATHWQSQIFSRGEFRYMFNIPLENRIEIAHPDDTALAIVNAIRNFNNAKGNTLIISSGPRGRMLHKDRVAALMKVFGLPMPPADRFTRLPHPSDRYDTEKSQDLLHFQNKTFADCIKDYQIELTRRYSPLFLPLMRYFIGPIFGKLIVRRI